MARLLLKLDHSQLVLALARPFAELDPPIGDSAQGADDKSRVESRKLTAGQYGVEESNDLEKARFKKEKSNHRFWGVESRDL